MFCSKCGQQNNDEAKFCSKCGAVLSSSQPYQQPVNQPYQQPVSQPVVASDNSKLFNILSYIGILWLFGLLINPEKQKPDVRFHVGQGILLSIVNFGLTIIGLILAAIFRTIFRSYSMFGYSYGVSAIGRILIGFTWIAVFGAVIALMVLGIINAAKGIKKPLPIIGRYAFYK